MMSRYLALTVLLLLLPARLLAHQQLLSSSPADSATLTVAPEEIRLTFNQGVEPALASLRLIGPGGEVTLAKLLVEPGDARILVAAITGDLQAGPYRVEWGVTGSDGHPVRGEYGFTIAEGATGVALAVAPERSPGAQGAGVQASGGAGGGESAAQKAEEPVLAGGFSSGSPLYGMIRWLTFAAIVAAVGTAGFATLLLPALRRRGFAAAEEGWERAREHAAGIGFAAAAALAMALVLRGMAQLAAMQTGAELTGAMVRTMLLRTPWGWGWLLQGGATLLLLAGLVVAARRSGAGWGLVALAAIGLALSPALSGHAAATSAVAVLADGLHVLAAGGWLGTLLLLVAVGIPSLTRPGETRSREVATLISTFTPIALTCAALLTLTGVYASWLHLTGLSSLWTSAYGRTLLVKLILLTVVFAAGAYNWRRATPALERGAPLAPLRRSTTAELAMGALVLAATAALVATPPPTHEPMAMDEPATLSTPAEPAHR